MFYFSSSLPNKKSNVQPHMSHIINAHSGFILVLRPLQRFVIFILCVSLFDSGHNFAAISVLNILAPLSFALARASSILKFFILTFFCKTTFMTYMHILINYPCSFCVNISIIHIMPDFLNVQISTTYRAISISNYNAMKKGR